MKIFKIFLNRIFVFGFLILIQILWVFFIGRELLEHYSWIHYLMRLISLMVVLWLVNKDENPSYKISWIIVVLLFPMFGGLLYLLIGNKKPSHKIRRILQPALDEISQVALLEDDVSKTLTESKQDALHYLSDLGYGTYLRTKCRYYSLGDYCYGDLLKDISQAKKYIFMEYFIVSEGLMFENILKILAQKVQEGVEVRFIYDDVGSITTLPYHFEKKLEQLGIQCVVFNPFIPLVSARMNHRDHRKICIIDGNIGYSGGFNLADEYINVKVRFGHWKDTGIRLEGDAVQSLTVTFLEMWNAVSDKDANDSDFSKYLFHYDYAAQQTGFVQPYADSPMDNEQVGEEVYISMINKAEKYCWFMTPYLIITDEMTHALCLAAKRGVDVRIITPGIPDKKFIYNITRSFYHGLVKHGVRVYEWTPGFCHAKMSVADDCMATCGTINLDYRSLYHHFENGCFMADCQAVVEIKNDLIRTMGECRDVTDQYQTGRSAYLRLGQLFMRLFAGLL